MKKVYMQILPPLVLLSACATRSVRVPASAPAIQNPTKHRVLSGDPSNKSAAPTATPTEANSHCGLDLDQMYINNPQGAPVNLWRVLHLAGAFNAQSGFGGITGSFYNDRQLLAAWFSDSQPGTELFEAAQSSRAAWRAVQFITGAHSDIGGKLSWQEVVFVGPRMAATLAVMQAVSQDPACVTMVREYAKKSLNIGGVDYSKELDALPYMQAAQAIQKNQLPALYEEVNGKRQHLFAEKAQLDQSIARKEKQNASDVKSLDRELRVAYADLKADLAEVSPCGDTVAFATFTQSPDESESAHAAEMVDACREKIATRLAELREQQADMTTKKNDIPRRRDRLEDMRKRREEKEAKLEDKYTDALSREVARLDKEIENTENKINADEVKLNDKLADTEEKVRHFEEYKDMLDRPAASVTVSLQRINTLMGSRDQKAKGYQGPEFTRMQQIDGEVRKLDPSWWTYSTFGGGR